MATPDEYIRLIAPAAQEAARRYGVWASVAIGQSILETGWGRSPLAQRNNHFGVKWHHNPNGPFPEHVTGVYLHRTTERPDSGEYVTDAYFRTYDSPLGSALDYADNLRTNPAYAATGAFNADTPDDFIRRIGPVYTGGDSSYAGKVLDLMGRYNLRTYDTKETTMNSPLVNRPAVPHRNKYGRRPGKITRVILHNWASTGGGDTHLAKASVQASTNYFVYSDGGIAVQVPEQYRAWTSGGAAADNPSITIETQNSTMGPKWEVSDRALDAIARLLADIGRRYGWGSITPDRLRGHREFQSTTCPGPYLWARMGQIRQEADRILKGGTTTGGGGGTTTPGWDGRPIRGGIITTPYGQRGRHWSTNRDSNGNGIHTGDDWNLPNKTPIGTPLYAVADGTVTIADGGALGLMSIIRADNGRFYRYCHCRKGSRSPWNGERVRAGQKIAEVGNTGNITAPHLHLEDTSSAQLWPPAGHRKPSWPVPDTTIRPEQEEEEMPEVHITHTEFDYGGGWLDEHGNAVGHTLVFEDGKGWPDVVAAVPGASKSYKVSAQITADREDVQIRSRWVFLDPDAPDGWHRHMETIHATHSTETARAGEARDSLLLDIWVDKPCRLTVGQQAEYFPA